VVISAICKLLATATVEVVSFIMPKDTFLIESSIADQIRVKS